MMLRLAWRELWHTKTAVCLQVAGLTVAIATLAASALVHAQTDSVRVPGSACGNAVREVIGVDAGGSAVFAWTPRQRQMLLQAMAGTPAAEVMSSTAKIRTAGQSIAINAAYVGAEFFNVVCVGRRNALAQPVTAPFLDGAVADATVTASLTGPKALQLDAETLGIAATTVDFAGLQYDDNPTRAWIPVARTTAMGAEFQAMDGAVFRIYVRPRSSETEQQITRRLFRVVQAQPALFRGVRSARLAPVLQIDTYLADKIAVVTKVLMIFAIALLLLCLLNLVTYHAGRMSAARALAATLTAVGIPPRVIQAYAAIEPVLVAVVAWLLGCLLSAPLGRMAMVAVTNDPGSSVPKTWVAFAWAGAVAAVIGAALAVFRAHALTHHPAQGASRAKRALLRKLPSLLSLQVALAGLTLTLAAQSAVGLFRALPPPPNFPLDGLSVVELQLSDTTPNQAHMQLRWASAWSAARPMGYDAALSSDQSPFLPNLGELTTVAYAGRSTRAWTQYVSANFFDVLGLPIPGAAALAYDPDPRRRDRDAGSASHAVLSRLAAEKLRLPAAAAGAVIRYHHEMSESVPDARSPAAIVAGIVDDGLTGARGAVGEFNIMQLSTRAQVPVVYQSLDSIRQAEGFIYVFVRHPPAATETQIANALLPAIQVVLPGAVVKSIDSGTRLYRAPLTEERAMALMLAGLAAASMAIGLLGMLSLMALLFRGLKLELAVRFAVGATRRQVVALLTRQLLGPAVIGAVLAILPAAAGIFLLARMLESTTQAGVWGPACGLVILVGATGAVAFQSTRIVQRASFMDWLRCE